MNPRKTIPRLLEVISFVFVCSIVVYAQTKPPPNSKPDDPMNAGKGNSSDDGPALGPMEEEMRAKRAIKFAEKEYHENLDRAREVAQLGTQVRDSYKQSKAIGRDDLKKLERLEKLTKRIRSEAGGSDEDISPGDVPNELEPAISRLAEVAESLRKVVEKTPRQVISAAVIEQANVILQLVRFARRFGH